MRLPRYVSRFRDRHGKWRYLYRRKGIKPTYLHAEPNSAAFHQEIAEIESGRTVHGIPGSFDVLIAQFYQSPRWTGIGAQSTRTVYRNLIERFRAEHGHRIVADTHVNDIDRVLGRIAAPTVANRTRKLLIALFDYALKLGMVASNPAALADARKVKSAGFHTWSDDEIAAYEAKHPPGTKAHLAMALLLYTAQRRSDIVKMRRDDIKGAMIAVTQQKTGKQMAVPVHPRLAEAIAASPIGADYILESERRRPFTSASFGNRFRKWCDQAGLPQCSAHGLRKAASRRMAEIGMTNQQIKSLTGHSKDDEIARYTRAVDQEKMASEVVRRLAEAGL